MSRAEIRRISPLNLPLRFAEDNPKITVRDPHSIQHSVQSIQLPVLPLSHPAYSHLGLGVRVRIKLLKVLRRFGSPGGGGGTVGTYQDPPPDATLCTKTTIAFVGLSSEISPPNTILRLFRSYTIRGPSLHRGHGGYYHRSEYGTSYLRWWPYVECLFGFGSSLCSGVRRSADLRAVNAWLWASLP